MGLSLGVNSDWGTTNEMLLADVGDCHSFPLGGTAGKGFGARVCEGAADGGPIARGAAAVPLGA